MSQCQALTKAKTRCKHTAQAGSLYCWQHQDYQPSVQMLPALKPTSPRLPVSPKLPPTRPSSPRSPASPRSPIKTFSSKSHKMQLESYITAMNTPQQTDILFLQPNFSFLKNEDEALYEAEDFFIYHWDKINAGKIMKLNDSYLHFPYYDFDGFNEGETTKKSSFIVVSIGSSSTQSYYVEDGGKIVTSFYETGTNNFKESIFNKMMTDIYDSDREVLFINSIGFGIVDDIEFLNLKGLVAEEDLKMDTAGKMIIKIKEWMSYDEEKHNYVVVNSNFKPKFKNKWTNALAMEYKSDGISFFCDYGGGKISISVMRNGIVEEESLANFKYDQDPVIEYYQSGGSDIPETLLNNSLNIYAEIIKYIAKNKLEQQYTFNVLIRQTGKLREFYFGEEKSSEMKTEVKVEPVQVKTVSSPNKKAIEMKSSELAPELRIDQLNLTQLKDLAKRYRLSGYSNLRKAELAQRLKEYISMPYE